MDAGEGGFSRTEHFAAQTFTIAGTICVFGV
jgi:hypothetical protein